MDMVFTSRNIVSGHFGKDPGPTRFLSVPEGAPVHRPEHAVPRAAWFETVQQLAEVRHDPVSNRTVGDILVYVHGFNTELKYVLERHRAIRSGLEQLGYLGAVVTYDWPCEDTALSYLKDRTSANLTAIRLVTDALARFAMMVDPACQISTHILAHSMGAYVVREAFDDADDRSHIAAKAWNVSQVMFASADVSADSMRWTAKSAALYNRCLRLTNYANPYDAVLSISNAKRLGVSPRVGRIGLPADAPSKAVNVNVGTYYDTYREDFAGIAFADHSWYFTDPTFLKDVLTTISGHTDRNWFKTRMTEDEGLALKVPRPA